MTIPYSKRMLIERVSRHFNSGFAGNDFNITTEEMCLYIDAAIPFVLKGQMYEGAKVDGVFEVPDAYLVTYEFTVTNKKDATAEWYVTLPQPPLALPKGYDIPNVYLSISNGRTLNGLPLSNKRASYRNLMPKPNGFFYRVEGYVMYLQANNNQPFLNEKLFVQMPISRTASMDDPMAIPDDAISPLFDMVIAKCKDRLGIPQDVVDDNLPAGNKQS